MSSSQPLRRSVRIEQKRSGQTSQSSERLSKRVKTEEEEEEDVTSNSKSYEILHNFASYASFVARDSGDLPDAWLHDLRRRATYLNARLAMKDFTNLEVSAMLTAPILHPDQMQSEIEKDTFKLLEDLRTHALGHFIGISNLPAEALPMPPPSVLCQSKTWHKFQDTSVRQRNSRPLLPETTFTPLELMHLSFYQYTELMANTRPLDAIAGKERPLHHSAHIAATDLTRNMPNLYTEHNIRLFAIMDALRKLFPDDPARNCYWRVGKVVGNSPVDLAYEENGVVLIIVEVKLELGTGGEPNVQANNYYALYLADNRAQWDKGAPVFLITICGTIMTVSGGFFDGSPGISPISQMLGPAINLVDGSSGFNLAHATRSLFTLYKSIQFLRIPGGPFQYPRYPRILPLALPVEEVVPDRLYRCKLQPKMDWALLPPKNIVLPDNFMVKIAFTGNKADPYGHAVHEHLAKSKFAPKLIYQFRTWTFEVVYMAYLPVPTESEAGWVTLFDYARDHKDKANEFKTLLRKSLRRILNNLKKNKFVHGDLRSANIMIEVEQNGCPTFADVAPIGRISADNIMPDQIGADQTQLVQIGTDHTSLDQCDADDAKGPYLNLSLVDFDWAGEVGKAQYPFNLNTDLNYPGRPGDDIAAGDDEKMMDSWLERWPEVQVVKTPTPADFRPELIADSFYEEIDSM